MKDNKHNDIHLASKNALVFVLGHYLFLGAHSFLELRVSQQIMSANRYPCIFSRKMAAIMAIQLFGSDPGFISFIGSHPVQVLSIRSDMVRSRNTVTYMTLSTSLILAVCRTRVTYEPSKMA